MGAVTLVVVLRALEQSLPLYRLLLYLVGLGTFGVSPYCCFGLGLDLRKGEQIKHFLRAGWLEMKGRLQTEQNELPTVCVFGITNP